MKKTGRILLVAALASSLAVTPVLAAPSTEDLESKKAAAQSEVSSLQEQLTELLNKIGKTEENLIATGEKIIQAKKDLETAQKDAEEQYDSMKLRIQYMYENGSVSAVEALITSESLSDFLSKAEYIQKVHTYDRQKLKELEETEQEIKDLKDTLEKEQEKQEKMQAEYEAQEEELTSTLETKKAEVADFDAQIQAAAEAAAAEAIESEREQNTGGGGASAGESGGSDSGNTGGGDSSQGGGSESGGGSSGETSGGNTSTAQTIVNAAYGQLGVPYVYGGSTPGVGLDCSGLVQYCHSVAGISLPRTSWAQGGCGVAVSSPQPGDIVCYGSHVGIYIGGGKMIHAPKPGDKVKIASVYGSPWYRRCW